MLVSDRYRVFPTTLLFNLSIWCKILVSWVGDYHANIRNGYNFWLVGRRWSISPTRQVVARVLIGKLSILSTRWWVLTQIAAWFVEHWCTVSILASFSQVGYASLLSERDLTSLVWRKAFLHANLSLCWGRLFIRLRSCRSDWIVQILNATVRVRIVFGAPDRNFLILCPCESLEERRCVTPGRSFPFITTPSCSRLRTRAFRPRLTVCLCQKSLLNQRRWILDLVGNFWGRYSGTVFVFFRNSRSKSLLSLSCSLLNLLHSHKIFIHGLTTNILAGSLVVHVSQRRNRYFRWLLCIIDRYYVHLHGHLRRLAHGGWWI